VPFRCYRHRGAPQRLRRQVDSFETDLEVPAAGAARYTRCSSGRRWSSAPRGGRSAGLVGAGADGGPPVACRQGNVLVTSFHPELSAILVFTNCF